MYISTTKGRRGRGINRDRGRTFRVKAESYSIGVRRSSEELIVDLIDTSVPKPSGAVRGGRLTIGPNAARWLAYALLAIEHVDVAEGNLSAKFKGDELTKYGWQEAKEQAWSIQLRGNTLEIRGPGYLTIRDESFDVSRLKKETRTYAEKVPCDAWEYKLSNGKRLAFEPSSKPWDAESPMYFLKFESAYWCVEDVHRDMFLRFFDRQVKGSLS